MKVIGIDLAGKETNPTGMAVLTEEDLSVSTLGSDDEILSECKDNHPDVVAIDAPLNFPVEGSFREADSELISRGHRVLPPSLGGMKFLTERGIRLAEELREQGFEVIEIHPRTSGKILFETPDREEWIRELEKHGWKLGEDVSEHEVDAALTALTGLLYLKGEFEKVGEKEEEIIIPRESLRVL
ncbi:hypothetical protein AKJ48_00435 [candidate division MSBL1 archaeon SCGC-AAA261O19]|uniref:DUF429 domain-containing protein n=1 Tax=candidate division MSBL1 archaeon SCGC-AAA261O19 TaxID=1698277 RepID=A0A133VF50_9EURY|nr:hypothetical protein AKJ48_00435 [candidate division MSBL1 archaeon SCGC-AAA261O19]